MVHFSIVRELDPPMPVALGGLESKDLFQLQVLVSPKFRKGLFTEGILGRKSRPRGHFVRVLKSWFLRTFQSIKTPHHPNRVSSIYCCVGNYFNNEYQQLVSFTWTIMVWWSSLALALALNLALAFLHELGSLQHFAQHVHQKVFLIEFLHSLFQ